jgi:hypothetical protein
VKKATRVRWVKPARSVRQVQLGQLVPLVLQGRQARADLKGPKAPKATQAILDPTRPPQLRPCIARWRVVVGGRQEAVLAHCGYSLSIRSMNTRQFGA